MLGAVVRLEPPWAALPQDLPPPVRTLVQRGPVKDPHHRVANISTARFVAMETCASLAATPGAAPLPPRATGAPGVWAAFVVPLPPSPRSGGGAETQQGRQYDVARDGRFLINTVLDEASAPITLLMNWQPGAKP